MRRLSPEMDSEFGLCFSGRLRSELTAGGAKVHDLGMVRLSRPWTVLEARKRFDQTLKIARPDVVVMHGSWPHTVFGPIVRRCGLRLVLLLHNDVSIPRLLDRWSARTAPDLVLCNSRFTALGAGPLFPRTPIDVCYLPVSPPTGISNNVRNEVRTELGTGSDTKVILQSSRLERWKGQSVLLRALSHLRSAPTWECWIAGGPQRPSEQPYYDELLSEAESLDLTGRIRFLGQRGDVRRLLAAADVFCQPNVTPEPFGIAFVEALYAGLPVVTSNFGGGSEIVTAECGILTRPGDERDVSHALQSLLNGNVSRSRFAAEGPIRAELLCDPARQMNKLREILFGTSSNGLM